MSALTSETAGILFLVTLIFAVLGLTQKLVERL